MGLGRSVRPVFWGGVFMIMPLAEFARMPISVGMTDASKPTPLNSGRMTTRPAHLNAPAHLSPNTPVPTPSPIAKDTPKDARDATRYGDWELKGIAVDF